MADYRETLGISDLAASACDGNGVRIAVVDTGIPRSEDFLVCHASNLTADGPSDPGHATFIGSMLFGKRPVRGICPRASAGFFKVFSNGTARPETVARAIRAAADWKAGVINLSLGFSGDAACPKTLSDACAYAHASGSVLVAAAGNGTRAMWPAGLPDVVGIGPYACEGVDFLSSDVELDGSDVDGTAVRKRGTSFYAALATGVLALLLAANRRSGEKAFSDMDALKAALSSACRSCTLGDFLRPVSQLPENGARRLRIHSIFGRIGSLIRTIVTTLTRRIHGNEQF